MTAPLLDSSSNDVGQEAALLIGLRTSLASLHADITMLVGRNEELERLGRAIVDAAIRPMNRSLSSLVPAAPIDALTVLLDQILADRAAGR